MAREIPPVAVPGAPSVTRVRRDERAVLLTPTVRLTAMVATLVVVQPHESHPARGEVLASGHLLRLGTSRGLNFMLARAAQDPHEVRRRLQTYDTTSLDAPPIVHTDAIGFHGLPSNPAASSAFHRDALCRHRNLPPTICDCQPSRSIRVMPDP
jgi:hypothetical protein